MKKPFFAILWMSLSIACTAGSELDSLRNIVPQLPDSQKVYVYSDLCFGYRFVNSDSALYFGECALSLALQLNDQRGQAQALNDLGIIYADRNEYDTSLEFYGQSLEIRTLLGDTMGIGALHNKMGIIHQKRGAYHTAIEHQLKALRMFEYLGIDPYVATCQNNVAILHFNLKQYNRALAMHMEALETRKRLNNPEAIAMSHTNIGNVYLELGDTTLADTHYSMAAELYSGLNLPEGESTNLHNHASCFLNSDPARALLMLKQALEIRTKLDDDKMLASTHALIGNALSNLGRYREALGHFRTALKLSEAAGVSAEQINANEQMARLYRKMGNADSTYYYLARSAALKDSVFNESLRQDFAELQTRYETERKEASIALLTEQNKVADLKVQRQRNQMILLVVGLVLLLVTGLLAYLRVQARRRAEIAEATLREREAGLQAVISATEAERSRIARDLHDGVGQQLSGLKMAWQKLTDDLQSSGAPKQERIQGLTEVLDSACADVREISHRMMPRSLERYGLLPALEDMVTKTFSPTSIAHSFEKFGVKDLRLPTETELAVYRVVQELVNNILKHAHATEVQVQVLKNASQFVVMVSDNGKGFDPKESGKGMGLRNMESRLRGVGGDLHFDTQHGTHATIRINLQP